MDVSQVVQRRLSYYRLPLGFERRRGYRSLFVPDAGRHVVEFYRLHAVRRDGRRSIFYCRRCGLDLDVLSSCLAGSCLGGCFH